MLNLLTVDTNTVACYVPQSQNQFEIKRKFKSEYFQWDKKIPKPLYYSCMKKVCEVWSDKPFNLEFSLKRDRLLFLTFLSSTKNLESLVDSVDEDIFWERAFKEKWPNIYLCDTTRRWKHLFLEKYFTEYVENLNPDNYDSEELSAVVKLFGPCVRNLHISSLIPKDEKRNGCTNTKAIHNTVMKDFVKIDRNDFKTQFTPKEHISFHPVLCNLTYLVRLHITFQKKDAGTNYKRDQFSMSNSDAKNLSKGLANCQNLEKMSITRSDLDCKRVKIILKGLANHQHIDTLNFSHCDIKDNGVSAISKYICKHSQLKHLNLTDNAFESVGAESIAFALNQSGCKLTSLNLRLNNRLGSEGVAYIAVAIARGCNLTHVNLSDCGIMPGPLPKSPPGVLPISSRDIPPSCGELLARAIGEGKTPLRSLDISVNNVGTENDSALSNAICLSFLLEVNLKRSGMGVMAMAIGESAVAAQKLKRDAEKGIRFRRSAGRVLQASRVARGMNIDADPIRLAQQLSARPSIVSVASEEGTINIQPQQFPIEFGIVPAFKDMPTSSRTSSNPPTSRRSSHQVLEPLKEIRRSVLVRRRSDGSLMHIKNLENNRKITLFAPGEETATSKLDSENNEK